MDVLDIIEADHDAIEALLDKLATVAGSDADREVARVADLTQQLAIEIHLHVRSEEHIFYTACQHLERELRAFALAGVHHHHLVDAMLADLRALRPGSDGKLAAALGVMREVFSRHAHEEEEGRIFPILRAALSDDDRTALGKAILAERERLRPAIEREADRPSHRRLASHTSRGFRTHATHH